MKTDLPRELGWVRIACVAPELQVAAVSSNALAIGRSLQDAASQGADIVLFPELCLGGYSVADLHFQPVYLESTLGALESLARDSDPHGPAFVVGLPVIWRDRLYNAAAFVSGGRVCGVVPKVFLPNTGEYYERRWFASGQDIVGESISISGGEVPFGRDLVFHCEGIPGLTIGLEICEDLWSVEPPSGKLALGGATLLLNLSASDEVLGKPVYRRDLVRQQSARCIAAYAYASCGAGESTTDVVFSGHHLIAENGALLAEAREFGFESSQVIADVDIDRIRLDRLRNSSFSSSPQISLRRVSFPAPEISAPRNPLRRISPTPFIPDDPAERDFHCAEIFAIQSTGLAKRLRHTHSTKAVIGVSGGLDSALALLVLARAFDRLGLEREGIVAVVMPGPGTSGRTHSNAEDIVRKVGATLRVVPITESVRLHLEAIGHDSDARDVTYENAQARERTKILMNIANQCGGFVVGTGDLSEAALGWCTFNGDHMSMYHVNIGIPKTLVRDVIAWTAREQFGGDLNVVLSDILDTPVSPELLPARADGSILQETEKILGPYVVHDFFLYCLVRHGFRPAKILELACLAFEGTYAREALLGWLKLFIGRFFSQQFKRSAMPDGPKVGSVALSPRGDWRMPSDASSETWLADLDIERKGPDC